MYYSVILFLVTVYIIYIGRHGDAEEVSKVIVFLASDNASFITGNQVHIDGGRHIMTID